MPELMYLLAGLCFIGAAAMLLNRRATAAEVGALDSVMIGEYVTGLDSAGMAFNTTCAITAAELVFINDRGTEFGRVAHGDLSRVEVVPNVGGSQIGLVFHRTDEHHPTGNIVFRSATLNQANAAAQRIRPRLLRPTDAPAVPPAASPGARRCVGCGAIVSSLSPRCEYCNCPAV